MEFYIKYIEKVPLFHGIERNNLYTFLHCLQAKVKTYEKNETIFHVGEPARYVGIVLTGSVHLVKEDYFGNRDMFFRVPALQIFAEAFAYSEIPSLPISAIAAEKSVIMFVDRSRLHTTCHNVCDFHQQLIRNLLMIISQNNILLSQKLEITAKRTTKEKIMAYLMFESEKSGRDSFSIPFDRQTLADYLGVERSAMSAEIGKLRNEGKIEVNKNHFRILRT